MELTIKNLLDVGVTPTKASLYIAPLNAAMARFGIVSPQEVAAFTAQLLHECAMLNSTEEGLSYSSVDRITKVFRRLSKLPMATLTGLVRNPKALANAAYAGVNGNIEPGDGYKYRGRGCFQLTGRDNYSKASQALNVDYISNPDLVARPTDACLTAAWYWSSTAAQKCAREGNFVGCTKAINGPALLGHAEREALRTKLLRSMTS